MEAAFVGFVLFASKHLASQFIAETGASVPSLSGLNGAIDKATGRTEAFTQQFVDWCVLQFGTPDHVESE